ncbi:MAG: lipopolysaccharide heptosyltransferase family protein, partial [Moorea sp. SIO2B7]|nr:lipopolysaccharide heptosyltransferase family protein [Moorena sp. SIO2B7]
SIALFGPTEAKKLLPPNSNKYIGVQSISRSIADIQPEEILKQIWRG